ncbi:MAG: hypothetical protein ACLR78_02060 [Roseburia sp.]
MEKARSGIQNRRLTEKDIAESVDAAMAAMRWKRIRGKQMVSYVSLRFQKAASTSNGNLYDDVNKALAAESAGGTVTLEADVTAPITISSAVTLDLNGKNVTSLIVNDPAAKIMGFQRDKGNDHDADRRYRSDTRQSV